ncbi:MAG TPA: SWIM zinc finger family protein [Kofleriaceae bacterium]|nr:SWIM zinc finger family protein [Kofleriaceae bacterium]
MSWGYGGFRPYVSAEERRRRAASAIKQLGKKRTLAPIAIEAGGRQIARTFWGKAWCDNLERYRDFAYRLERGRSYVRGGAVIDLQLAAGRVDALVSGSDIYEVKVEVAKVPAAHWKAIRRDCAGRIDSLVELLRGSLSDSVMERICRAGTGLFPAPAEITFDCSCPDVAVMCKHVAAVLYGVGARLDASPELLFVLRALDHHELLASAGGDLPLGARPLRKGRVLAHADLGALFGLDLATGATATPRASRRPRADRTYKRRRAPARR